MYRPLLTLLTIIPSCKAKAAFLGMRGTPFVGQEETHQSRRRNCLCLIYAESCCFWELAERKLQGFDLGYSKCNFNSSLEAWNLPCWLFWAQLERFQWNLISELRAFPQGLGPAACSGIQLVSPQTRRCSRHRKEQPCDVRKSHWPHVHSAAEALGQGVAMQVLSDQSLSPSWPQEAENHTLNGSFLQQEPFLLLLNFQGP